MSDGAHQGITPERALGTILGGDRPPEKDEGMSRQEMREKLRAVDLSGEPQSYDDACMQTARLIYDFITEDPLARREIPAEAVYEYDLDANGEKLWNTGRVATPGLYDVMKEEGIDLAALGLTGFQWGWAVNAARYALGELPVPNPAIIEVNR